jgi:peptide deformylase
MSTSTLQSEQLQIVHFPHPALRHKSKPVKRVDAELRKTIRRMFELMYAAKGVGLAANQVDLPLRLFVVNLAADPNEGDELVFINPVLDRPKGSEEAEEGCLSLPGLYGPVIRPKQITVKAFGLTGQPIEEIVTGLYGRVIQHETDHLDGIMFTDRLSETAQLNAQASLEEFEIEFRSKRDTGEIPADDEIAARLAELESIYCLTN